MLTLCLSRLDLETNGGVIQDYLFEKTGQQTVPNIFISQYMHISIDSGRMLTTVLQTRGISAAPMTSLLPKPLENLLGLSRRKTLSSHDHLTPSYPASVPRRIYNHPRLELDTVLNKIHVTY